jgi:RNA polymerase sigma-70 factor (ECF subfamily)
MTDDELGQRLADYRPLLLKVALGRVGVEDAEDVAAEATLRAWRGRGRFDGANLGGWLVVLCRHACRDRLRTRARRPETVALWEGLAAREPGPEAAYLRAERDAAIHLAVGHLSPDQQRAIRMRYFTGLSGDRIGALLGCPRATVNTQMWRGRAALRRELAGAL